MRHRSRRTIYQGGSLCYTGNIVARFKAAGLVTCYTSADYVKSTVKWQVGDILMSSSHVVVVVNGRSLGGSAVAVFGSIDELARAVIAGRYGVGDARRAALGEKYTAVQARVNELLSGTPNAAGTSIGTARIIAGTYKVVCDKLYVRGHSIKEACAGCELRAWRADLQNRRGRGGNRRVRLGALYGL